ncbi:SDR family oxidoreductase [Candidatus Woesebacteria bacterium]|nr:MAG: SDR family oxidoreductase [Candidatus Woesebacteria bacterium]
MKKVVLITGGSDGLGRTIAKCVSSDYQVVILSPTEQKLKKVAKEIGVDYVLADVSNYASVENAIKLIIKKYKQIDCLVNNAGLWIQGELDDNDITHIENVMKVNALGVIYITKAIIPLMKKRKSGLIININSQGGLYAKAERSVYSAAKWGITGFTKSLQPELAKYGIAVTGIYPGKLDTKMFEKIGIDKDMTDALDTKEVARVIKFLLESPQGVVFPEIGIMCIKY